MQGMGSRCPHLVGYIGLDSQKSTIVLGWATGTRRQHGPRAVAGLGGRVGESSGAPPWCWVEPDPIPPHSRDPHHTALRSSRRAARLPEVVCHCPSSALTTCSGRGALPGRQGGMRARSRLLEAAWVPPCSGAWALPGWPQPCTGGTVELGTPLQATDLTLPMRGGLWAIMAKALALCKPRTVSRETLWPRARSPPALP